MADDTAMHHSRPDGNCRSCMRKLHWDDLMQNAQLKMSSSAYMQRASRIEARCILGGEFLCSGKEMKRPSGQSEKLLIKLKTKTTMTNETIKKRAQRFRKWLLDNISVELGRMTAEDVDLIRQMYMALPEEKDGQPNTAVLQRMIRRALLLVDDCDFQLTEALERSREIEALLKDMRRGTARFCYVLQRGGEQQEALGTQTGTVAGYVARMASPRANVMQISFYDVERQAWRSMHAGNYIGRM